MRASGEFNNSEENLRMKRTGSRKMRERKREENDKMKEEEQQKQKYM